MADQTTNLLLPYILASQAQKHVTMNDSLQRLDGVVQLSVLDRDLTAPPASPSDGDRYLVAAGASGVWAGWSGDVALYVDGSWRRLVVRNGWVIFVEDEERLFVRSGAALLPILTATSGSGSNGSFVRYADGRMECRHTLNLGSKIAVGTGAYANPYRTTEATWTFPSAFSAAPSLSILCSVDSATQLERALAASARAISTTSASGISAFQLTSNNVAANVTAHLVAVGRWF